MDFHNTRPTQEGACPRQLAATKDPAEALQDFPEDALSSTVQLARDTPVSPMIYS